MRGDRTDADIQDMEQFHPLRFQEDGPEALTRAFLVGRLQGSGPRAGAAGRPERLRGDHNLNPGTCPAPPFKPAAVLIPLVERPEGLAVLLTERTRHLAHHAGQVSFPGGRMEEGDGSPEETALRETEEEIGLSRECVEPVGRLDLYITRTAFEVTPVVAMVHPPFTLVIDDFEVAEAFEVPLAHFLDPANHHRHHRRYAGQDREFFAMPYDRHYIWGATAGMLMDLYQRLTGAPPHF